MDTTGNQETSVRRRGNSSKSPKSNGHENGKTVIQNTRSRDQVKYAFMFLIASGLLVGFLLVVPSSTSPRIRACEEDSINSDADLEVKDALDEGDEYFYRGLLQDSLATFSKILMTRPKSPRALWGYARAVDVMSQEQNEALMAEAMTVMYEVMTLPDVPRELVKSILQRLTQLYIFKKPASLDAIWTFLSKRFARDIYMKHMFLHELLRQQQAWERAERILKEMIETDPADCLSMATLGRFYSVQQTDHKRGADLLQRAIDTDCTGIRKIQHYLALSHAYVRLGQTDKAAAVHELGATRGIFLSRDQRSIHNANFPLTARPWWTHEQSTYKKDLQLLEENWKEIRDEALSILKADDKLYRDDSEDLTDKGRWQKLLLYHNGRRNDQNCKQAPKTCKILSRIPDANTLTRGQIKFSVLKPGTHLWAHSGPTNCRLRAHLGLQIPEGPIIRVGNDTGKWTEGKFIIFDDSFDHEVWFNDTKGKKKSRLVLMVDFWHPDITMEQRKHLRPCN